MHMRLGWMKKTDWIGVIGVLLLLVGAPGYLAQDPETRALGAWQDFGLPPPRIGDRVVFDLVVQESGQDPVRARSVVEVVHRAPEAGEVPATAVFVQEVRFFPHHTDLGPVQWRQNASVIREYYDDVGRVVWRTIEGTAEHGGTAVGRQQAERVGRATFTTWLQDLPQQAVEHRGDVQATIDRLILSRSEFLYEKFVMPTIQGDAVRDRLVYEDQVVYGGRPIVIPGLSIATEETPPCLAEDPHTYVTAGGQQLPSPRENPEWVARNPPGSGETELRRPDPLIETLSDSVVYDPKAGWSEPWIVLRLGPHELRIELEDEVALCQGGKEHVWYHPDVPFAAGFHVERGLQPNGDRSIRVDLLPSLVEKGKGEALPMDDDGPFLVGGLPGGVIAHISGTPSEPHHVLSGTSPIMPLERVGPQIALSDLAVHDGILIDGWSLAELDTEVRTGMNMSGNATLAGFAFDQGNETNQLQWWLLYAEDGAPNRILRIDDTEDATLVEEVPCPPNPYGPAMKHRLHLSCRPPAAPVELSASAFIDPVWILERLVKQNGRLPHAFSYEPLATIQGFGLQQQSPLAFTYLQGQDVAPPAAAPGGAARWTMAHVGPHHSSQEQQDDPTSWGVIDLRDGEILHEIHLDHEDVTTRLAPAAAVPAELSMGLERTPIRTSAIAAGGAVFILIALLARLAVAAKGALLYPTIGAFYARIDKGEALSHERRDTLVRLLETDPGLTPSDVDRRLEWGWGATVHHLETLRKNGHLVRMQVGRSQHYFPLSVPDKAARLRHVVLRTDDLARFLELVEAAPGISLKDLDRRTSLKRPTLSKIGSKLVAYGLVRKERDGKLTRFFPTVEGSVSKVASTGAIEIDEGVGQS